MYLLHFLMYLTVYNLKIQSVQFHFIFGIHSAIEIYLVDVHSNSRNNQMDPYYHQNINQCIPDILIYAKISFILNKTFCFVIFLL